MVNTKETCDTSLPKRLHTPTHMLAEAEGTPAFLKTVDEK